MHRTLHMFLRHGCWDHMVHSNNKLAYTMETHTGNENYLHLDPRGSHHVAARQHDHLVQCHTIVTRHTHTHVHICTHIHTCILTREVGVVWQLGSTTVPQNLTLHTHTHVHMHTQAHTCCMASKSFLSRLEYSLCPCTSRLYRYCKQ